MNIFFIDRDPRVAAEYLCDQHVQKMLIESCQMLSTVIWQKGNPCYGIYDPSYPNHPCTRWTGESASNYDWLVQHAYGIFDEWKLRFKSHHSAVTTLRVCDRRRPDLPDIGLTPVARAFGPFVIEHPDCVDAYRQFYRDAKPFARWTRGRGRPAWACGGPVAS